MLHTPHHLVKSHTYVAPDDGRSSAVLPSPNSVLEKAYNYGTERPGYREFGRLDVADATRPSLLIGVPAESYMMDFRNLKNAKAESQRVNFPRLMMDAVTDGGRASLWSALIGICFTRAGVALAVKSCVAGLVYGLLRAIGDVTDHNKVYDNAMTCVLSLSDLVTMLHTERLADWMHDIRRVEQRRSVNPEVFDQATAELIASGITPSWAATFPPAQILFEEMDMGPEIEFPEVPRNAAEAA